VVALATLVALVLRLAFALGYWVDKPMTHDEHEYLLLARSLASGQGFRYPASPSGQDDSERFGRAPLYPFVISRIAARAVLDAPAASVPRAIKIGQSIIGALAIPLVAAVAWRAGGPVAGALGAGLAAIHPPLVWTSAYALSEVLYLVIVWLSAALFGAAIDRRDAGAAARTSRLLLAAGVVGGFAALTRPSALAYLMVGTLWLALAPPRRRALFFLLGAALIIAPWTARNVREHGRLVLVASEGGITFWTGNHPLARGEGDMAANPAIKRDNQRLRLEHRELSPEALERVYYREAFAHITAHPIWWMGLEVRKLFYLFVPVGPSYALHSRLYQLGSVVPYLVLLPLAIAGARLMRRTLAPAAVPAILFVSTVLVCLAFFPQERFRIPEIDPTLIVCAAVWLGQLPACRKWFGERA
jgi:4-amino-4-deoxy-L-arabinose transferase-like glycosyltransferase